MDLWLGIRSIDPPQPLWEGPSSEVGTVGPFRWPGGDLAVTHMDGLPWKGTVLARVEAERLADAALLEVVLPSATAEIEVVAVPVHYDAARLRARGAVLMATPDSREGDSVVFAGLLPGGYVVGPRELVEQESSRREYRGFTWPVEVAEGERVTVRWDERWAATRSVTTRIRVVGPPGAPAPFLVPVYGLPGVAVPAGGSDRVRLTPGPDGTVTTSPGEPVPRGYLVGIALGAEGTSYSGVFASLRAGETTTVELAGLEFELDPEVETPRDFVVELRVPYERMGPYPSPARSFSFGWNARRGPLRVCIPTSVDCVDLRWGRGRTTSIGIDPRPGEVQRLRVRP